MAAGADATLKFDTNLDTNGLSAGLGKIGDIAGVAFKGVAVAVGAASTAIGVLGKSAIEWYADYEQLVGGIETLFGAGGKNIGEYAHTVHKSIADVADEHRKLESAQNEVLANAAEAYKTAGLSMNDYLETVTGFSASLIQSLGGDTSRAAKIANKAIIDMSDNANKMGTDMADIQRAYQGFAKQNYTMLDNLKLGFGGTKEEMERLLAYAGEIANTEFDISSFADIVNAIHIVQTEMGITGTTVLEAEETISGSLNMMKASWENLVVGLADGNADIDTLISQFVDSAKIAGDNLLPTIETTLNGISELISLMLPQIVELLPGIIINNLPRLVEAGIGIIQSLITGISENLDSLIETAVSIMLQLVDLIIENLPLLIEAGLQIIIQLAMGIVDALPELMPAIVEAVILIVETLIDNLDLLIEAATTLIMALTEGIINAIPILVEKIPELIISLVEAIVDSLPLLIEAGIDITAMLGKSLVENIPRIVSKIPELVMAIVNGFSRLMGKIYDIGAKVVSNIADGIARTWSKVTGKVSEWINSLKDKFMSVLTRFTDIGKNIVEGIWGGISDGFTWIKDKISGWVGDVLAFFKKALGISSPSKEFEIIGKMCVAGFDNGMDGILDEDTITRSINASVKTIGDNTAYSNKLGGGAYNQTININREISTPDELARAVRLESRYGLMKGVAFA